QDLRFGSEDLKGAFSLVRLLEGTNGRERYDGPRHFDAHAYRSEDHEGVWDFARGCMRTYKILKARAHAFDGDKEVRDLLAYEWTAKDFPLKVGGKNVRAIAEALRLRSFDTDAMAQRGFKYERLDQLMIEHIMGVRA